MASPKVADEYTRLWLVNPIEGLYPARRYGSIPKTRKAMPSAAMYIGFWVQPTGLSLPAESSLEALKTNAAASNATGQAQTQAAGSQEISRNGATV